MGFEGDTAALLAALEWQIELGADEAIGEVPVNRFDLEPPATPVQAATAPAESQRAPATPPPVVQPDADPVEEARHAAAAATDLESLREAMAEFPHCDLRRGARSLVFSDGRPEARLMIVGEAPGRDEDLQGKPFVGRAGQLLDRMLAAIDMRRDDPDPDRAVYITNVLPWRPPQNRDPTAEEIAMMKPFVERHIALADPDVLVLMGNISCFTLMGKRGITRLRGTWTDVGGRPALPMFHPAYLLRTPSAKREAWADLLELRARLRRRSEP